MKSKHRNAVVIYRRSSLYFLSFLILFVAIGMLTTVQPAYRFSSSLITEWTKDINAAVFFELFGTENKSFQQAFPEEVQLPKASTLLLQLATNLKPDDPRSLLGKELPGFSIHDNRYFIAGEGTDYTNLPIESSPPLEEVMKDRLAIVEDPEETADEEAEPLSRSTGDKEVVFIYNTHNRESFLPSLPGESHPDSAHHSEMNITKVSERLAESLRKKGIGTQVDKTDIGKLLDERGWEFWQSYDASREVVEEAFSANKDIQFVFDLHRDSQRRDKTTKEINGKSYAKLMFVVGLEHKDFERNFKIASEMNRLLEEKYPGLSRGVLPKEGSGTNGIYNQDLSGNAMLIEFGGVDNTMEELYRSADALAEVFSEYYWKDAQEVSGSQ